MYFFRSLIRNKKDIMNNPTRFITLKQSDNLFYLGIQARKDYIKEKLNLMLGGNTPN